MAQPFLQALRNPPVIPLPEKEADELAGEDDENDRRQPQQYFPRQRARTAEDGKTTNGLERGGPRRPSF